MNKRPEYFKLPDGSYTDDAEKAVVILNEMAVYLEQKLGINVMGFGPITFILPNKPLEFGSIPLCTAKKIYDLLKESDNKN